MDCPECEEPLVFTFRDTSGQGAHKRGDDFNTVPDTDHYICFSCATAWKQRLKGPLVPDVVGDLAFFTCRDMDCGQRLGVIEHSAEPTGVRLGCKNGHVYAVVPSAGGGLELGPASME